MRHTESTTGLSIRVMIRCLRRVCVRGARVSGVWLLPAFLLLGSPARSRETIVRTPAEIATAMATALPGDTLTMANGTWTNVRIIFDGNGAAGAPILLRAQTQGSVVVSGASNLRIGGSYLVVDGLVFRAGYSPSGGIIEFRKPSGGESSNCRLTNTSIEEFNPASATTDYKWISLYGAHNRVDHCYLRGKNHAGTTLVVWLGPSPNYHMIDHNHFAYRPPLGVNGGETIRVGTSDWSMYDSYTVVEYNLFEECNGETEIISSKSCGNVYRFNTFRKCQGTLTLRHGNRCTVQGNYFFGEGVSNTGGIRIIGEDHVVVNNYLTGLKGTGYRAAIAVMNGIPNSLLNEYYQVKRATIAFNTLVGNTASLDVGVGKDSRLTLPPLDCVVANLVVTSTTGPLVRFTDTPVNLVWEGNLFHGASLGISQPSGITLADPLLGSAGSDGIRRPQAGSPVINAAVGLYPGVLFDVDGQERDSLKDVGADEVSALPVVVRPLVAADVGPVLVPTDVPPRTGDLLIPGEARLLPAYPNPFNPGTTLQFSAGGAERVTVEVFTVLGERVTVVHDGPLSAGVTRTVRFDGTGLPSGLYVAVLTQGSVRRIQKLCLIR